jgi:ribosomal protein L14E/L6E/L27E
MNETSPGSGNMDIRLGSVVKSKSGRDAGRMFVVCGIIDDAFVFIADGDLRKIDKPKRKRMKHLEPVGNVDVRMTERLTESGKIHDHELREALAVFKP